MRKHLLRILTVLLLVCFGACLFAACGETGENPDDQPTTYTLTYNANGGSGADVSESHKEGDKFKLKGASTFTRENYTLTGWSDGSKTYAPVADFEMPAQDVTLKAQWEEKSTPPPTTDYYTVTMAKNDNVVFKIVEPAAAGSYTEGTVVKFTVTAKSGYTVKSVKNGNNTLTADADGNYSVTVGKANIVITVETEAVPTPTTYTVTVTGDHVTATFDEQGPYAEGKVVKFSLKVDTGYELVSVKNGNTELTETDGKYQVTVAKANITITVTTKTSGGEDKPTRSLSDFVNANVAEWGANGIQIVVRAKATGYDVDSIKQNLKLVAGDKEYAAFDVNAPAEGSQIWTIYFGIETASEISSKTQLTLKDGTTTYENIANAANQQVAKVGNSTYSLTLEGTALYLNVTTEGGGEEPPVEVDREIKQTGDLDFYADDFFKLPLSAEDITWIQQNVAYVTVDGTRNGFQDNKGFLVDGAVIQIQAPGSKNAADKNEWTLIWYNSSDEPIAKTIAQRNWEPAPREGITSGGEGDSTDAWIYWNDDAAGAVTVTEVTLDEDETDGATVTAKFRSNTSTLAWGFQLFYNNTTDYSVGKTYRLTLTVTAKSNVTLAINGREYELTANVPTPVDMTFVYSFHLDNVVNYDYGTSLFDVQIHLAAETDYDVTFANIKWTEAPKVEYEKGELVEGALSQELVQSEEGKEKDKFILWWAADAGWGCGSAVTLTPDVSEIYKDNKIAFTYRGGSVNYSVQLFYSNTKLQDNTQYYLTLKIKLTAAADVNIGVNGKTVTLKAGQVNDVEVLFTNTAEAKDGHALSSLDIQFPGTELVDGVDSIGIEVSDVKWYYVKGQEPQDPTEKSLSFTAAKVEAADGKAYLVLTAASTLYTEDDLKSFVIFNNDKEITVDVAKSQLVVNGESTLYFDITALTSVDSWYWMHLKINGENWDADANGNLKYEATVDGNQKIEAGNHRYYLTLNGGTQLILVIEEVNVFYSAHLELVDGTVYYVLDANMEKYTEEQIRKSVLFEGDRTFNSVDEKFETISEGNGRFRLFFDITALTGNRFYPHIKLVGAGDNGADIIDGNGDVKCTFDAAKGTVTNGKTRYTMVTDYDMPCVEVVTIPDNFYETTKVELITKDNKAYLVLTGTYIGYDQGALQTILDELYIDLQNAPEAPEAVKDGRDQYAVYKGFPRTVTVEEGGTWKIELEVTMGLENITYKDNAPADWKDGAYLVHFGTKNDAGDGADLKVLDAQNGQTVTINGIVYTLRNFYGIGEASKYWGCVGLSIEDPSVVKKDAAIDYSTIKFEEADGKVYLVIGGTNQNCEKADFKFDVEYIANENGDRSGKLYPDFTFETAEGKFTIKVDLTTVPGNASYYMHLVILGSGAGNVASQTNEGYNVAKVDPYEIEIRNTVWGPWSWVLKVASKGPVLNFVKGEGAEGEDPEVDLGEPNGVGVYTIRLPESTYTAPANKYFRGWEVEEIVYFPGEIFDIKSDAVTFTAVWEDLYTEGTVSVNVLDWFTAGSASTTLMDGKTAQLVATVADKTPVSWHGIISDLNMTVNGVNYWLHFRVDGYVWTAVDGVNSNTEDNLKNLTSNVKWVESDYTGLFADGATATAVITASLANNKLTYTYANYAATDAERTNAITSFTWEVTSSLPISSLNIGFLFDDGNDGEAITFSVTDAKLTGVLSSLSENQAPTAENPINLTVTSYQSKLWTSDIRKGEKLVLSGSLQLTGGTDGSAGANHFDGWDGVVLGFYSTGSAAIASMRLDNYVNGCDLNSAFDYTAEGLHYERTGTGDLTQGKKYEKMTLTIDWTGENILYTVALDETDFTASWTISAMAQKTLADAYKFDIGGEDAVITITSLARTSVKPVEPEVPAETKTIVPVEEVNKYDPSYISIVVSSEDYELLKTADKVVVNGYTGTDWEGKGFELVGPVGNGSKINVRLSLEAATPGEYVMNWVIGDKVIATYTYTVVA